jgi:type IV secretion system protein VirB10
MMSNETAAVATAIPGDRGSAVVSGGSSMQSRLQGALALGVVALVGGGFLAWYYSGLAAKPVPEQTKAKQAAQAETKLPPLGPAPPRPKAVEAGPLVDEGSVEAQALLAASADPYGPSLAGGPPAADPRASAYAAPPPPDPVLQRRLEAPVLIRAVGGYSSGSDSAAQSDAALDGPAAGRPPTGGSGREDPQSASPATAGHSALAGMLKPSRAEAVAAGVLPDRRFLLPKGAFIDCTLETAIDSTLPGLTTCVLATDVWSADGSLVLLERGTKLVGETRGAVQVGQRRLFVLWSEARTPAGVVVELASPGTDALGRSGVTGEVDTRFAARFGAAILISLIDAAAAAVVAAQSDGSGSVVIAPQGAGDVMSEVLRSTVNVPPTIRVAQGERLQVLVARDVSFAEVYALADR